MKALWLVPIIGALLGSLVFLLTLASATGAPQEAAGHAMAIALAVIPYVLVRAVYFMTETRVEIDTGRIAIAVEKLAERKD
jgi:hypothetical protein